MPELPEVEFVRRQLSAVLPGRKILSAELLRPGLAPDTAAEEFSSRLVGRQIEEVSRRGKFLIIGFSESGMLAVHLRMTGMFAFLAPSDELPRHTHLVLELTGGKTLAFCDQRHFARVYLAAGNEYSQIPAISQLAPEPFPETFSFQEFTAALQRCRRPIKDFLLDQTKVCGLGNIYAAEALFRAAIHPAVRAYRLGPQRRKRLYNAILETIADALTALPEPSKFLIDCGAEVYGDDSDGRWFVYGRTGKKCPKCSKQIRSIRQSGRTTFYCPGCQRR